MRTKTLLRFSFRFKVFGGKFKLGNALNLIGGTLVPNDGGGWVRVDGNVHKPLFNLSSAFRGINQWDLNSDQ